MACQWPTNVALLTIHLLSMLVKQTLCCPWPKLVDISWPPWCLLLGCLMEVRCMFLGARSGHLTSSAMSGEIPICALVPILPILHHLHAPLKMTQHPRFCCVDPKIIPNCSSIIPKLSQNCPVCFAHQLNFNITGIPGMLRAGACNNPAGMGTSTSCREKIMFHGNI